MKQLYLKTLVLLLMCMVGGSAMAYDCEVDGIYYNLNQEEMTAEVTVGTSYSGGIVIPSTITYSGNNYSVTSIGKYAFIACSGLTSVTIPNSVTSIGMGAFSGCSGLTSVTIPNSVTSIGMGAFSSCTSLTSITVESGNTKYDSRDNCNAVIETATNTLIAGCMNTVIPNSVTSIEQFAFSNCSGLTSVIIPNSVTSIGEYAFSDCSSLTSIAIPNRVTSIGEYAFSGCSGLTSVTIPNSVTSIERGVFYDCSGLTSVTIPNSVTSIGESAFAGCNGLTSVAIPNSVTSIGYYAFSSGPNLEEIIVEPSNPFYDSRNKCNAIIKTADNELILGCKNTIIPNNVTSIGLSAFYGCTSLKSITIPNSVTSIGSFAFRKCTGLKKVIVSDIASWCAIQFGGDDSNPVYIAHHLYCDENTEIKDIVIPENVNSIGNYAFSGCIGLTSIIIPNSVTSIGSRAFKGCSGLASVTIPNSLTSIEYSVFEGCSGLTSVTIPNSVTSIGNYAFDGCTSLKLIICDNPTPPTAENSTFPEKAIGIVPESAVPAYKAAKGWSRLTFNSVVFDYIATQTTIKLSTSSVFSDLSAKIGETEYYPVNDTITITNLKPNTEYKIETFCKHGTTEFKNTLYVKTKPVTLSTGASTTNLTATVWGSYDVGEIEVTEHGFEGYSAEDITQDESGRDVLVVKDLKPGTSMSFTYYVVLSDGTKLTKQQTAYTKSIILSTGYSSTNVTLKVWGKHEVDDAVIKEYGFTGSKGEQKLTMTNCKPGNTYTFTYYVITSDGTKYTKDVKAKTEDIKLYLQANDATTTTVQLTASYSVIDATVLEYGFVNYPDYLNETEAHLTGLNPGTDYKISFYVNTKEGGKTTKNVSFTTKSLILKTLQPRVISVGNVIVAAESNIDDVETNVGFEWRRTDWTNDFESNRGGAYLFDGMMEGYIRNLNADKLWKYRPYYTSNSGKSYYGEWVGLDPSNTSYFEPTVHTYAKISVEGNAAQVKGYVMRGSDNVVQQGFKYWKTTPNPSREGMKNAPKIPSDAKTVEAEGTVMTAELKGLDYESEYCVVAFVKTSENEMFYGEQQTFQTGIDTSGVEEVTTVPGVVTEVARYDLNGRKVSAEANSSLFTFHSSLKKGLNIIRMSDGTVKKVMVK